jgi:hypothetical protein
MPGRLNKREVDFFYPNLVVRDGEYCRLCGQTPNELKVEKLEIHEIKYERPLKIANMCLLCHGCNHLHSLNKENIEGGERDPTVFRTSRKVKPVFLEYVSSRMQESIKDGCDYRALVADSALYTGMAVQTIRNWLYPLHEGIESPYIAWGDRLYLKGREPRGKVQNLPTRNKELNEEEQEELK